MKRSYLLIAIALIALGFVCDWRLSHAVDGDRPASAVDTDQPASAVDAIANSEVAQLLVRIESLEKRVASLERTEPLVRQADSRDSELEFQTVPVPPPTLPQEADHQNKDDAPAQRINGQTWRFRLLGN